MPKASGSAITAGRKGSDLEASSFTKGLSSFRGMLGSAIASISAFTDMGRADVFTDLRLAGVRTDLRRGLFTDLGRAIG